MAPNKKIDNEESEGGGGGGGEICGVPCPRTRPDPETESSPGCGPHSSSYFQTHFPIHNVKTIALFYQSNCIALIPK